MRPARLLATLALLTTLALLAGEGLSGQDKEKKKVDPGKSASKGQLPKYWDELGLTDTQRAEVVKLSREQRDKVDKLKEEIRKLDEEYARKRVAVLTDDQRKKLIDLVAGPEPKTKDKDK
jgi:Spy/CpxP family protein refolding chaperone